MHLQFARYMMWYYCVVSMTHFLLCKIVYYVILQCSRGDLQFPFCKLFYALVHCNTEDLQFHWKSCISGYCSKELVICIFEWGHYIIHNCSTELVTINLQGARCIIASQHWWLAIWTVEIVLCGIVVLHCKLFNKRKKIYKFSLFLYMNSHISVIWHYNTSQSGGFAWWLVLQFADVFQADQAGCCYNFCNWNKSTIKMLTTEQPFRQLHCDCTAETSLVGQKR